MIRYSAFLLAAFGLLLALCGGGNDRARAGDKKSPAPITKPGEYPLHDGKVLVKVFEQNGMLDFEIKIKRNADDVTTIRADQKLKPQDAVWVIHAESSSKVRVLWGPARRQKDNPEASYLLSWQEVKEEKGVPKILSELIFLSPETVMATLPKVMAEALPKESVAKLKGKK